MWQLRKVISNKLKMNSTYLATTNYWAPLHNKAEQEPEQINMITTATGAEQLIAITKSNKWMH